jgi:2-polyprenyl-6-methoxyphenol hydroxylase-like FAD-dependent oxidoreductase
MSRTDETEVLVIGGGPVGMFTALLLAEEGIDTRIIDKEERTATHSYACVLHPATLQLLDRLGLTKEVRALGRPIDTVAFYEGDVRRAEIRLSELPGNFQYALALPQSGFEQLLEDRLLAVNPAGVHWNHRLTDLHSGDGAVVASIDKLAQSAKGYIVAEWDWMVQKQIETTAAFVVGADGHDSTVRSLLDIEYQMAAGREQFAVFEFETDDDAGAEVRIAMDATTTNVLWPLPGGRCRWSFQLVKATDAGEFPAKERETLRFSPAEIDERMARTVARLARSRAPWFTGTIRNIQWAARVRFEHRLAKQFGSDRAWLAGDAAHQTGPVGGQSMNAGLLEAEALARTLKKILRDGGSLRLLQEYHRVHHARWEQLLNRGERLRAKNAADPWLKERAGRILSCVPATGDHFLSAIERLGFEFDPAEPAAEPVEPSRRLRAVR